MEIDFFIRVVEELDLGEIKELPSKVSGGLTHRMFKLFTTKGKYIVKLLNPNIMKRDTAIENFNKAEKFEEILKLNDIEAIYSIKFNGKKMQQIEEQYFYVYEWFDGKTLKDIEINNYHCQKIGAVLSKIHNIDLQKKDNYIREKHIDFEYYINLAKKKNPRLFELLDGKLDILNESMNSGNLSIHKLPKVKTICHNDMDSKNVMWLNDEYKIIDLECLDYANPYLELYELALCWPGYETCNINFSLFKTFLKSYFSNSNLDVNIDWENIYYANNGRLEWLEFNIKRALEIECNTKEEQELGFNEVKDTIEHVMYYKKEKEQILNNLKDLIS